MKKEYSMKYYINPNQPNKSGCWIARYKDHEGNWKKKSLPIDIERSQALDAERWLISWLHETLGAWGVAPKKHEVKPVAKTLLLLAPKWLDLRFNDVGTKINTYGGFSQSVKNWILDNARFPHLSIQDLNLETDFSNVSLCREWIQSMKITGSNKLKQIGTLRTLIDDCIAEGWLDENMTNPFDKKAIRKLVSAIKSSLDQRKIETYLTAEQVEILLTKPCRKVRDYRRVRYLLAIATGMRDHETEGLLWSDIHFDAAIPYVVVQRQLDKIGKLPAKSYEELAEQGMSKSEIMKQPNAIISDPKYHSNRMLPLHPLLALALQWWRKVGWQIHVGRLPEKTDPVFARGKFSINRHPQTEAGNFSHTDSAVLIQDDLRRLGIDPMFTDPNSGKTKQLNFHSLRHTFATLLDGAGIDEGKIGALMGHKAGNVTRGYIASALGHSLATIQSLPLPSKFRTERTDLGRQETTEPSNVLEFPTVPKASKFDRNG